MSEEYVWPKHFRPLPPGWKILWLDSGHFVGIGPNDEETPISWDRFWVRRVVIARVTYDRPR